MARPTDADSAETFARIIDAATALLVERGVAKLSMRGVAERAGVGLGTLNYYFSNKQGLLEACLDEGYQWVHAAAIDSVQRIASGQDAEAEILSLTRLLYRRARGQRHLIRMRLLTTMEQGALPGQRLRSDLLPVLDSIAASLTGSKSSDRARRLRLSIHSFELLIARYAVHSDEVLQAITGTTDPEMAISATEKHLEAVALHFFRDLTQ